MFASRLIKRQLLHIICKTETVIQLFLSIKNLMLDTVFLWNSPSMLSVKYCLFLPYFDMFVKQTKEIMFRKGNMVLLADMIWTCGHQLLFHVIFGYFLFTSGCFCLHLCVRTNHNNLNQLFPFRRLECSYGPVLINNTPTTFFFSEL